MPERQFPLAVRVYFASSHSQLGSGLASDPPSRFVPKLVLVLIYFCTWVVDPAEVWGVLLKSVVAVTGRAFLPRHSH